jgi:hypothetical protein
MSAVLVGWKDWATLDTESYPPKGTLIISDVCCWSMKSSAPGDGEGETLGEEEGDLLGLKDGLPLGLTEGDCDGDLLGDREVDGDNDGEALGDTDGETDGDLEGLPDGETEALSLSHVRLSRSPNAGPPAGLSSNSGLSAIVRLS